MDRDGTLVVLSRKREFSVLIIGGGINGIGTFRDLALNGVDVLLVDRGDFCSGTSAASSHMAHGGIRYLENGEFRLVREAVGERNRLLRNAAHLVRPLPTTIPIFRTFSGLLNAPLKFLGLLDRPSERGALVIKLGLMLYDAYTGRERAVPRHNFLGRAESIGHWPGLNRAVRYTATYYDGAILQPERLGLELLLDAEAGNPEAHAVNYMELQGAKGREVLLKDVLTGRECQIEPRLVINAAGPWIDSVNRAMGNFTHLIGGTKGSHLVVENPELRAIIGEHEFFFENKDGRIVLLFPLYDRVLVGTSDIPMEDPDRARCTEEEVDYFLEMIGRVFPAITVTRAQIVFRFSGVRPLAASSSKSTGQITRDHEIQVRERSETGLAFPVYSLVGGKWTSFRAFSEQVTDRALEFLGKSRTADTRSLAIGGGRGYPSKRSDRERILESISSEAGMSLQRADVLFERYGTRASEVAKFIASGVDAPLEAAPEYSRREMGFLAEREKVVHLDDVLLRRTMLAMLGLLTRPVVEEIADVLAIMLHWDHDQRAGQVARCLEILRNRHQMEL
jgi:glycerol-3-phosphate dehydrogenase